MIGNDVHVITVSLEHPTPFISTGTQKEKWKHDKISRFTPNFVICGRVTTGLMGPTDQRIMKLCGFSCKISQIPGSSGNSLNGDV